MPVNRQSRASWSSKVLAAAIAACAGTAAQGAATVDPDLAARLSRDPSQTRFPVILRLAQQPDAAAMAQKLQGVGAGQRGGRLLEALKAFNAPLQAPLLQ